MQRKTFLADIFTGKTNEWTVKKNNINFILVSGNFGRER